MSYGDTWGKSFSNVISGLKTGNSQGTARRPVRTKRRVVVDEVKEITRSGYVGFLGHLKILAFFLNEI